MTTRLIRKLDNYVQLSQVETRSLLLADTTICEFGPRRDILREYDEVSASPLLLEGIACRYKLFPDGRRQLLGYMVPGDMCDPRVFLRERWDISIATLSRAKVAFWPKKSVFALTSKYPRITRGFWWSSLVDEAIAYEWLVNLAQRTALERLSHLICELYYRLSSVGLVHGDGFDFPMTQAELGDTLGLSAIHVNRTLQDLRRQRLVRVAARRLTVLNLETLSTIAMFNPRYLQLKPVPKAREGQGDRRAYGSYSMPSD